MPSKILMSIVISILASGCSTTLLNRATVVAPKQEDVNADSSSHNLQSQVSGDSCRNSYGLIGVIQIRTGGITPPNIDEALGKALAQRPESNALVNAKVEFKQIYAGLYERDCIRIHGIPAKL